MNKDLKSITKCLKISDFCSKSLTDFSSRSEVDFDITRVVGVKAKWYLNCRILDWSNAFDLDRAIFVNVVEFFVNCFGFILMI